MYKLNYGLVAKIPDFIVNICSGSTDPSCASNKFAEWGQSRMIAMRQKCTINGVVSMDCYKKLFTDKGFQDEFNEKWANKQKSTSKNVINTIFDGLENKYSIKTILVIVGLIASVIYFIKYKTK